MNKLLSGTIFDIKHFSIHDGSGIRTTIFFKGCPLRCQWCHNPESQQREPQIMLHENRCITCVACVDVCPNEAIAVDNGKVVTNFALCSECGECTHTCFAEARELIGCEMSVTQVITEIERDLAFYDESGGGVTFSGGEPLWQKDFVLALLQRCQELEIHTAVDTSGAVSWQTLSQISPYVNLFLYDLKLMDDTRHKKYTAVSNHLILENLKKLSAQGNNIILRFAIIPGINDDDENIHQTAAFAASLPHIQRISILPYHATAADKYRRLQKPYPLANIQPPSQARMATIAAILSGYGLEVKIGG